MNIEKIIKNYEKAKAERDGFQSMMTDVYTYCIPSRNGWTTQSKGARTDTVIYNSYPVSATKNFASTILSLIVPNGIKFFDLKAKTNLLAIDSSDDEQNEALQDFNKKVSPIGKAIFEYISSSNFYIAMHEALIDLAAGTGGILCTYSGDDSNPLLFQSLNMAKISFSESSKLIIDNVYQDVEGMSIDVARATYPEANFPDYQDTVSFLVATIYDEQHKKYHYMILDKGDYAVWMDIEYDYNPFVIFRWSKLAGETWGRGILTDNLGAIKTANLMKSDILTASQRVLAPPTIVTQNSLVNPSNVDFSPNSIITVKPIQGVSSPITTLPFTGNLPFGMEYINQFNQELNTELFNEPLGSVGQSQQTATEVSSRMQLYANRAGSSYSRLQIECLSRVIDIVINILTARGIIPALPDNIKITFSSPILHMQKQQDFQKTMQAIQSIAQVAGNNAQQAIAVAVDLPKLSAWIPESLGADMSLFRTTEEVKTMMNQMQQIAQQQQTMQQMQQSNPAFGTSPVTTGVQGVTPL
jgi:hypothetical protein